MTSLLESGEESQSVPMSNKGPRDHLRGGARTKLLRCVDANYATCPNTLRSISGGAVMMGQGTISGFSKVQKVTALGSSESKDVGFMTPSIDDSIEIHEDYKGLSS